MPASKPIVALCRIARKLANINRKEMSVAEREVCIVLEEQGLLSYQAPGLWKITDEVYKHCP